MERCLFFDCSSGLSGDMAVAALLDLGADEQVLRDALASLKAEPFEIKISRVMKSGIDCCDFDVILKEDPHDHDMDYLYGHEHGITSDHEEHHHDHDGHRHRHYSEVREIIDSALLTPGAREMAHRIFALVAEAESRAHRVPVDEVAFHEVGAMDSIVDVIAFAVCFDNLGVTKAWIPRLCDGTGTVRCQHGVIPVPVPAVVHILSASKLKLQILEVQGELLTPTGAAIAASIAENTPVPEVFTIEKAGYGAGKRDTGLSGMARALMICLEESEEKMVQLETNVDDCTGEQLGFLMGELFAHGARDVHWIPCYMKKNRPGTLISVICTEKDADLMETLIFRHTTTLGIRRTKITSSWLERTVKEVMTPFGKALVKECIADGNLRFYPEYESAAEIAGKEGIGYMDAWQAIVDACEEQL